MDHSSLIGSGATASVYAACKKNEKTDPAKCKYVVKIIPLYGQTLNYKNLYEAQREMYFIENARKWMKTKDNEMLSFYFAEFETEFSCGSHAFFVASRFDTTFAKHIDQNATEVKSSRYTGLLKETELFHILRVIRYVNDKGFLHGDPHVDNFLYKSKNSVYSTESQKQSEYIVMSDFGAAGDFKRFFPSLTLLNHSSYLQNVTRKILQVLLNVYDTLMFFDSLHDTWGTSLGLIDVKGRLSPFPYSMLLDSVKREYLDYFMERLLNRDSVYYKSIAALMVQATKPNLPQSPTSTATATATKTKTATATTTATNSNQEKKLLKRSLDALDSKQDSGQKKSTKRLKS